MAEEVAQALHAGDHAALTQIFGVDDLREAWWAGLTFKKAAATDDPPQSRREARDWLLRRGLPVPAGCIEG